MSDNASSSNSSNNESISSSRKGRHAIACRKQKRFDKKGSAVLKSLGDALAREQGKNDAGAELGRDAPQPDPSISLQALAIQKRKDSALKRDALYARYTRYSGCRWTFLNKDQNADDAWEWRVLRRAWFMTTVAWWIFPVALWLFIWFAALFTVAVWLFRTVPHKNYIQLGVVARERDDLRPDANAMSAVEHDYVHVSAAIHYFRPTTLSRFCVLMLRSNPLFGIVDQYANLGDLDGWEIHCSWASFHEEKVIQTRINLAVIAQLNAVAISGWCEQDDVLKARIASTVKSMQKSNQNMFSILDQEPEMRATMLAAFYLIRDGARKVPELDF